jgi:hypothetical protein
VFSYPKKGKNIPPSRKRGEDAQAPEKFKEPVAEKPQVHVEEKKAPVAVAAKPSS